MEKYGLIILIGYLFGCLQWSYILGKVLKKKDIRTLGGGNAGASNTVTVFGWKMGVMVGILDILKAIISILIIRYLFKSTNILGLYLNGTSVILGHNYPFFMKFKGGKGTASTVGMLFGIDYRLGILGILVILIVALATDYIALGTISLVTFFILATIYKGFGSACILLAVFIALQSIYLHIPNVKRILSKDEVSIRNTLKSKKKVVS
ncbi:glycerol-3-phosphate acyltransferase [Wansuia hejianensis]|uniref:Glycerol-3-phosphate acyltransferase n=1 Tax=Wansuia hejianensis TaxID=2763667 RepID=A0A926EXW1_9FIRM|nr:glycerol-3-phosphate acyltransferase [Wansuia hejianensis]MBC8590981.1 glycerol-3-phosphate acyltransferase [Wansuia hejianensis]